MNYPHVHLLLASVVILLAGSCSCLARKIADHSPRNAASLELSGASAMTECIALAVEGA